MGLFVGVSVYIQQDMDVNVKHIIQAVTDGFIVKVDHCQDKLFQPQKLETSHWFGSSSIK